MREKEKVSARVGAEEKKKKKKDREKGVLRTFVLAPDPDGVGAAGDNVTALGIPPEAKDPVLLLVQQPEMET